MARQLSIAQTATNHVLSSGSVRYRKEPLCYKTPLGRSEYRECEVAIDEWAVLALRHGIVQ